MHLKKPIKNYILYFVLLALAGAIIVLTIMTQVPGKEQKKTAESRPTLTAEISKRISSVECSEAYVEASVSIVPTVTEQVITQDIINDTADSDVSEEMNIVEETEEVSSADTEEIPATETTEEIYTETYEETYEESYGGSLIYLGDWTITYYCACEICCGEWASGYTASGTLATEGVTVACGSLPMGTQVYIDGIGYRTVEDTGVSGEWIDVFVNSHEAALQGGMYTTAVYLVQ